MGSAAAATGLQTSALDQRGEGAQREDTALGPLLGPHLSGLKEREAAARLEVVGDPNPKAGVDLGQHKASEEDTEPGGREGHCEDCGVPEDCDSRAGRAAGARRSS
ncbi:hypothetical protein H1C71_032485 [Ictidomys tridecemlineatus]|nr:hypothetical protein H1C71_032485 [Ictidomys tridecemlineatus]